MPAVRAMAAMPRCGMAGVRVGFPAPAMSAPPTLMQRAARGVRSAITGSGDAASAAAHSNALAAALVGRATSLGELRSALRRAGDGLP